MKHLIFFDHTCELCKRSIAFIQQHDKKLEFIFKPLTKDMLEEYENTMVLIENYDTVDQRLWTEGRAALRTFWLMGGPWKMLGIFCFLPFGANFIYRLIARHRHRF